jgi:hypothetical protein
MKAMKNILTILMAGAALLLAALPLIGHHSFAAQYDSNKNVTLTGAVTKIQWMNPHMYFFIDVKDAAGKVTNWGIENGNLPGLMRRGWRKDSLQIGNVVTIEGYPARDGSPLANAQTVKLSDGRTLFAGSSRGETP